jgi:hypothetical protein
MLADKVAAVPGLGLPRRHEAALRHRRDLGRVPSDFGERAKAERSRPALAMADDTFIEDDRRDVPGEGDVGRVQANAPRQLYQHREGQQRKPER